MALGLDPESVPLPKGDQSEADAQRQSAVWVRKNLDKIMNSSHKDQVTKSTFKYGMAWHPEVVERISGLVQIARDQYAYLIQEQNMRPDDAFNQVKKEYDLNNRRYEAEDEERRAMLEGRPVDPNASSTSCQGQVGEPRRAAAQPQGQEQFLRANLGDGRSVEVTQLGPVNNRGQPLSTLGQLDQRNAQPALGGLKKAKSVKPPLVPQLTRKMVEPGLFIINNSNLRGEAERRWLSQKGDEMEPSWVRREMVECEVGHPRYPDDPRVQGVRGVSSTAWTDPRPQLTTKQVENAISINPQNPDQIQPVQPPLVPKPLEKSISENNRRVASVQAEAVAASGGNPRNPDETGRMYNKTDGSVEVVNYTDDRKIIGGDMENRRQLKAAGFDPDAPADDGSAAPVGGLTMDSVAPPAPPAPAAAPTLGEDEGGLVDVIVDGEAGDANAAAPWGARGRGGSAGLFYPEADSDPNRVNGVTLPDDILAQLSQTQHFLSSIENNVLQKDRFGRRK